MKKLRPKVRAESLTQTLILNHPLCYFSHLHAIPYSGWIPYDRIPEANMGPWCTAKNERKGN